MPRNLVASSVSIERVVSVIFGLLVATGVALFAPPQVFSAIVLLVGGVALAEFLHMYGLRATPVPYGLVLAAYAAVGLPALVVPSAQAALLMHALPVVVVGLASLGQGEPDRALPQVSLLAMGVAYVVFLPVYLIALRTSPEGWALVVLLAVGTWARDIGAFVFGRVVRRGHAILPTVSPGKTYEGATGGGLVAVVVMVVGGWFLLGSWTVADLAASGVVVAVLGQVGDLVESWLKRAVGVRHSSLIIPGQGGVLDSLDSFVFTAPAIYAYQLLRFAAS